MRLLLSGADYRWRSLVAALIGACLLVRLPTVSGQVPGWDVRQEHEPEHFRFETQFRACTTNAPWLAMDWFDRRGVFFCRVSQQGAISTGLDTGRSIVGPHRSVHLTPGSTNWLLLQSLVNSLRRPSAANSWPLERRILVSGIQSNQWFSYMFTKSGTLLQVTEREISELDVAQIK